MSTPPRPILNPISTSKSADDEDNLFSKQLDVDDNDDTLYSSVRPSNLIDDQVLMLFEKQTELIGQLVEWQSKQDEHTKEQIKLLSEINARQDIEGASRTAAPSVPVRSASAWNPLLRSTLKKMSPTIDRWRGGLDTLLIFIGLFSAIVTSFLIEAIGNLKPDPADKTNALLANLTEIIVSMGRINVSEPLHLIEPEGFEPEPEDIRLNIYCFVSLIFALCTAALAVVGRDYLTRLTRPDGDAISRLTDIHRRWKGAQTSLGPFLETLPMTLTLPVFIFALGLVDYITSISIKLDERGQYLDSAFIIGGAAISLTALMVLFTVYHGICHPATSPFQSGIRTLLRLRETWKADDQPPSPCLSQDNLNAFHELIQDIHDDETLTHAVGPLNSLLKSQWSWDEKEVNTVLHLLSFEASLQCQMNVLNVLAKRDISGITSVPIGVRVQVLSAVLAVEKYHVSTNLPPGNLDQLVKFPFVTVVAKLARSIVQANFSNWDLDKSPLLALLSVTAYKYHVHPDHQWIVEVVSFHALKILADVFDPEFFNSHDPQFVNERMDEVFGAHAMDFSECQMLAVGLAISQDIQPHVFQGMMGWICTKITSSSEVQLFSIHVLTEVLNLVSIDENKQMYRPLFRLCWFVNYISESLFFPANIGVNASFTMQMAYTIQKRWCSLEVVKPTLWSDSVFTSVIRFLDLAEGNLAELATSEEHRDIISQISAALGGLCVLLSSVNPVTITETDNRQRRVEFTHQLLRVCIQYITHEDRTTGEPILPERTLESLLASLSRLVKMVKMEEIDESLRVQLAVLPLEAPVVRRN
ncbi:hypothetical protein PC9H_010120 [Pleurotus ostreatus]|uniref:DUF6535 domain-containing protein n=1 Tax=Pleurotus ostreatus TaxID=5322 RepID=A0A8H7DNL2_PLEOS|nr:uncharacterized protein PC9H_010120 [Pleurotus ostreatus]KAF7424809.1 hypothetical protein PC9H_010120 [Pleurotus ostreatus]KAJ8692166.1 hypothetical protein PTI98_009504 [Pleurotus ostreatus]